MVSRTEEYKKDQATENKLELINKELKLLEELRIKNSEPPSKPVTFIVGAPRSATTVTHQILSETGYYSYISNFIARFWEAPSLGGDLAKSLDIYSDRDMSYHSDFGRTNGWKEPHQFNYFWKKWLLYDSNHQMDTKDILSNVDQNKFTNQLGLIEKIDDKPLLFKSLYTGMQLPYLNNVLDDIRVVICLRDPLYQAQSNLLGRKAFFGNYDGWFSLKPPEYKEIEKYNPYEQVVAQIFYILMHIQDGLADIDVRNIHLSYYNEFMTSTHENLIKILSMIGIDEPTVSDIPKSFEIRNEIKLNELETEKLKKYVYKYFGSDKENIPFRDIMSVDEY